MTLDAKTKKNILKDIIRDLHAGGDVGTLQARFAALVKDVSGAEIGAMEQELIDEGLPETEVRRLCDLHVKVFESSLDARTAPQTEPGHPLHTLAEENRAAAADPGARAGAIGLDTGRLTPEQIDLMLTHLPVDISYVDENDTVLYYSATPERIFPRTPGVIGRKVQNCHPPKSLDVVERILKAFRAGERDTAEFWIDLQGKFIHIRYFALRDAAGVYKGSLEVSQDVTAIRGLRGERRLLDWDRPRADGDV